MTDKPKGTPAMFELYNQFKDEMKLDDADITGGVDDDGRSFFEFHLQSDAGSHAGEVICVRVTGVTPPRGDQNETE